MKRLLLISICITISLCIPTRAEVCHDPNEITTSMYDPNMVAFEILKGYTFGPMEPIRILVDVNEPDGDEVSLEVVEDVNDSNIAIVQRLGVEPATEGLTYHYEVQLIYAPDEWTCINLRAWDVPDPNSYQGPLGSPEPMSDEGTILVWVRSNNPPVIVPRCGG